MQKQGEANGRAEPGLQLVCVSHRPDIFARYVGSNHHVQRYPIVLYDNSVENVGIAERYNHFIEQHMAPGWVIFMHHDVCFEEDPVPRLTRLPRHTIYGVTGAKLTAGRRYLPSGLSYQRVQHLGRIHCRQEISKTGSCGKPVQDTALVDTVDCCCVIVHASLIDKYHLRFDPQFAWHFYAEDFSLHARRAHGVETRVVQMACGHYGYGSYDAEFYSSRQRLVKKYQGMSFSSTCYDPTWVGALKGELKRLMRLPDVRIRQ